jgi:hypothetical protein
LNAQQLEKNLKIKITVIIRFWLVWKKALVWGLIRNKDQGKVFWSEAIVKCEKNSAPAFRGGYAGGFYEFRA